MRPTHTSANEDDDSLPAKNFVEVATWTVTVVPPRVVKVKFPAAPATPQVPAVEDPLTEATSPIAPGIEDGGPDAVTKTRLADTVDVEDEPLACAPAKSPTQTLTNEADDTLGSKKAVEVVTSTVRVAGELLDGPPRVVTVNKPAEPAVPHAPVAEDPLTEATLPAAPGPCHPGPPGPPPPGPPRPPPGPP
jgi:hypothetical protein